MACNTLHHYPTDQYGECRDCGILTCPHCHERLAFQEDDSCWCESCGWFDPRNCPWPEKLNINGLIAQDTVTYIKGEHRGVVRIDGQTVAHHWNG